MLSHHPFEILQRPNVTPATIVRPLRIVECGIECHSDSIGIRVEAAVQRVRDRNQLPALEGKTHEALDSTQLSVRARLCSRGGGKKRDVRARWSGRGGGKKRDPKHGEGQDLPVLLIHANLPSVVLTCEARGLIPLVDSASKTCSNAPRRR